STGTTAPVTLATWVTATSLVRRLTSASNLAMSSPLVASSGATTSLMPMRSRSSCHGTILAWCSISVMSTSSPALRKVWPQLGDEVDGLGRVAHEDDLTRVGRVEEASHLLARRLIELGRARREAIDAAMHIGVITPVELGDAVDHRRRLLGGRTAVEEDEAGIVLEDRKIAPHPARVERPAADAAQRHGAAHDTPSPAWP